MIAICREFDSINRIFVQRAGRREHLVDLLEGDFDGVCNCENFTFTIAPHHERGRPNPTGHNRCVHIDIAREWFLRRVIEKMRNNEKTERSRRDETPPRH